MSVSDRWLLPDGVEELLPPQAAVVEDMRRQLIDLYQRWGYELVTPPLIEYLDSLLTGAGHDLDLQTIKITDQLTGRLMGIRADMTPQAARIDARSARLNGGVNRLCYLGSVLHAVPAHMLTSRTPIQAGCELYGQADVSADIEVISLMLESLQAVGISHIHVELAQVGVYRALIAQAGLSEALEQQLFDALRRRSIPEIDELAANSVADPQVAEMIRRLPRLAGGREILAQARALFDGTDDEVLAELDIMEQVAKALEKRFPEVEFYFDFCELRGYNYHTGLVFAAYAEGYGQAIAQGGRYDGAGAVFGVSRPATGFSLDVKALLRMAETLPDLPRNGILAPAGDEQGLWGKVQELRRRETVIQLLPGQAREEVIGRCDRELVLVGDDWQVKPLG